MLMNNLHYSQGFLPQITEVLTSKESAPVHEAAVFCLYQLSRYDSFAKIEFLDGNVRIQLNNIIKYRK